MGSPSLAGSVLGGLPVGGSAFLALATASVAAWCVAGVGALASQLAPTRRLALELGGAVVGVAFVLRVIADTLGGLGVAALGHAARLGRGDAAVSPARGRSCCCCRSRQARCC